MRPAPATAAPAPTLADSPRSAKSFYRPELDAVRFLAFLCVFLHHTLPQSPAAYSLPAPLPRLLVALANAAGFGLCLFFALSAYLICELLLREKTRARQVDIPRFYQRRILRIWPLYFLGLGLGAAWAWNLGILHVSLRGLLAYIFMVGNLYTSHHGWVGFAATPASPLWSISVEEQFYLLWPGAVARLTEATLHRLAWIIIAVANLALLYFGLRHTDFDATVWSNSFVQFYMFAAGILLALHLHGRMPNLRTSNRILLAAAAFLAWFIASAVFRIRSADQLATPTRGIAGYTLAALGCAAILLSIMGIARVPRWLSYLGRISYGLYVFHLFAIQAVTRLVHRLSPQDHRTLCVLGGFLLTLLLAMLSYRYFESFFLRLKDRKAIIQTVPLTTP